MATFAVLLAAETPVIRVVTDAPDQVLGMPAAGFFGVVGVLVGGIATTIGTAWVDTRRRRQSNVEQKQVETRAFTRAAALVDEELRDAVNVCANVIRNREFPAGRAFHSGVYHQYRGTLADRPDIWTFVSSTHQLLNVMNWKVGAPRGRPASVNPDDFREVLKQVYHARKELVEFSAAPDADLLRDFSVYELTERAGLSREDEDLERTTE